MYTKIISIIFFAILAAAGCSVIDNDNSDRISEPDLINLGEFNDSGLTVVAYSNSPLTVGYHEIFIDVHENGVRYEHPHIHFNPMMHMENHSHSSPSGKPGNQRDDVHNLYHTWAIFTMPGGMMGKWELQIAVHDQDQSGFEARGSIQIDVEESNRVKSFITEDEVRYILTLVEPSDPETGLNDLVIALHKRESMMNFVPVQNANFGFEPWMPSMDHGSANNTAPIHADNGFYHGLVNFNMTGSWELRFDIESDEKNLGNHVFELDF